MWAGISLHDEINSILRVDPSHGKVHSVFRKAINIIYDDGNMISLLVKGMDNCPFSIFVDIDDFNVWKVLAGEDVWFHKDRIFIGSYILDISKVEQYSLKRGRYTKNSKVLERNLQTLKNSIDINKDENNFNRMAFQMVLDRTTLLKTACMKEDKEEIIRASRSLLGLGQGLTPSGDDVLMGVFLVLGLNNSPTKRLEIILTKILEGQEGETTDVSYHGLLRASMGFYRYVLVEMVEELFNNDEIEANIRKILAIGHTSGRDLLYGIFTGFEIVKEKENENGN